MPLHVSSTMCLSSGGQNCITQHLVSSHSVGGRPVLRLSVSSLNLYTGPVQTLSNVNKQVSYLTPVGALGWTLFTVL